MTTRELRCTAEPACLDAVQDELGLLWDRAAQDPSCDVDAVDRMLFETALVEVLGNLVEHARTPAGDRVRLAVHLAVHPDRAEATVVDDGVPPPPEVAAPPALPDDELAEDGRGLALASIAADVTHDRLAGGNRWTVVRRRVTPGR